MRLAFAFLLSAAAVVLTAQKPQYHEMASTKQIMAGIQKAAQDSNASFMKAGGPQNDKEWEQAMQNANILGESAQLLLLGNRPKDQTVWLKTSGEMHHAAMDAAKAAEAKDAAAWKAAIGALGASCKGCHSVHRKRPAGQ